MKKKVTTLPFDKLRFEDWTFEIVKKEMESKKGTLDKIKFLQNIKLECELAEINRPGIFKKSKVLRDRIERIKASIEVYINFLKLDLSDGIYKPKKKHIHGDFLIWKAGYNKLEKFVRSLIKEDLLYNYAENDYKLIIAEHFECNGVRNSDPNSTKKLRWGRGIPLLAYLINELLSKENQFIHECNHPYALFSLHFLNKESELITNTSLNSAHNKYLKNLYKRPRGSKIVDKVIKTVQDFDSQ